MMDKKALCTLLMIKVMTLDVVTKESVADIIKNIMTTDRPEKLLSDQEQILFTQYVNDQQCVPGTLHTRNTIKG